MLRVSRRSKVLLLAEIFDPWMKDVSNSYSRNTAFDES